MKWKKGISLPINMLVILSIAVVVLLAVVAFFMGAFGSTSGSMSRQAKVDACCQAYVFQGGCNGEVEFSTNDCSNDDSCINPDIDDDWDSQCTDDSIIGNTPENAQTTCCKNQG